MKVKNINAAEFSAYIADQNRPALVEFMAPWCVYCRRIGPALEKLADQVGQSVVIAKVDIDEEPALARQERIEVVPTFLLYKGGQVLGSIVAPQSKAQLEAFLSEHLN